MNDHGAAVILGAGFGGLETTQTLRRAPVEITLIDRQNCHCFQPLLYQVATADMVESSGMDSGWGGRINAEAMLLGVTRASCERG